METKKSSLEVDSYVCAIKIKNHFFDSLITVGHIPHELSRHVLFFIRTKGGKLIGHVKSLTYRVSLIPSGGLEIPLQLTFTCDNKLTLDLMNGFVKSLYDWNYTTGLVQDNNDEDDMMLKKRVMRMLTLLQTLKTMSKKMIMQMTM